jgi:hypothetical protein
MFLETFKTSFGQGDPILSTSKGSFEMVAEFSQHDKGRSLHQSLAEVTLTTDASKNMYGGYVGDSYVQGAWSKDQSKLHINLLELKAVHLCLRHFSLRLQGKTVLVRSDNTTVVQYINKQGGTKSSSLCIEAWNLWQLAIQNNIVLKAVHLPGIQNCLADQLSRHKVLNTEWTLCKRVVQSIFQIWGVPVMDLFASKKNTQTPIFCSWYPSNQAYAIDALSIGWENMFAYAFPPICLIPKVLSHIRQYNCQIILIAPLWQRRHWFPDLLDLAIAIPIKLPICQDLLSQPNTQIHHPNPELFNLTAWFLSTNVSKRLDFLKSLEPFSWQHGERGHKKIIPVNSSSMIAGVVQGKLIPMRHL